MYGYGYNASEAVRLSNTAAGVHYTAGRTP